MANVYYTDFKAKQVVNVKKDPPPPKRQWVTLKECFVQAGQQFPFTVEYLVHSTAPTWPVQIVARSEGLWYDNHDGKYSGQGPRWRLVK